MKKLLLTLLLLLSLGFAASAETKTYEWTVSSSSKSSTAEKFTLDLNGVNWDFVHTSYGDSRHSQREGSTDIIFGSKNNPVKEVTMSVGAPFTGYQIESVSVTAFKGSAANITATVSINGVTYGIPASLTTTASTYDFNANTVLEEGNVITITFTNSNGNKVSNNSLKLAGVKVVYSDADSNAPVVKATAEGYNISVGDNKVAKGTQVTFTVENLGENEANILSSYNDEAAFVDGAYTATIDKDGMVYITIGEKEYTYNFTLPYEAVGAGTAENPYTVADALALIEANEVGDEVHVAGKITSITEVSTQYGNATYVISDGEGHELTIYRGLWLNGEKFTAEDQIAVGADVVVLGVLSNYQGSAQVNNGNKLISYVDNTPKAPKVVVTAEGYTIKEGETESNEVKKGTQVTFTVENAGDLYVGVLSDYDDPAELVDGTYTATISKDGMVVVGLGDDYYTYNFTLEKVSPKIIATFNGEEYGAGEYRVAEGTEVTFSVTDYDGKITIVSENDYEFNADGTLTVVLNEDATFMIEAVNSEYTTTAEAEYKFTTFHEIVVTKYGTWKLVTDASELAAGDKLIIASDNMAMSRADKKNNRDGIEVQVSNDKLKYNEEALIVELGGEAGAWTFLTTNYAGTNGYFASSTKAKDNKLFVQDSPMNATVAIVGKNATITFAAGDTADRIVLRYNNLFSCYASGYDDVQIYKYYEPVAGIVGLTHEVEAHGKYVDVNYMVHVFNHVEGDTYKVQFTVGDNTEEHEPSLVEEPAGAPMRVLDKDDVYSTETFGGTVRMNNLSSDTDYTGTLKVLHNGNEMAEHTTDVAFKTLNTTGIEDVTVDGNEEAEYFNLQGVRVAQPEAGQMYIVRRGAKVAKELVK